MRVWMKENKKGITLVFEDGIEVFVPYGKEEEIVEIVRKKDIKNYIESLIHKNGNKGVDIKTIEHVLKNLLAKEEFKEYVSDLVRKELFSKDNIEELSLILNNLRKKGGDKRW